MKPLSLVCLGICLSVISLLPSTTRAQRLPDSVNACMLLKHPVNFGTVQRNALTIISKSDEDCVLKFIDLLADSSFGKDHRGCMVCLDAICRVSNGEIARDLNGICAKLFHQNFNHLFEYIYKPNIMFKTQFEQTIIEGVGRELSMSKDPDADRASLTTFLQGKEQEMKMNSHQKVYAEALKDKILGYKAE
jgi:hypothetical protein